MSVTAKISTANPALEEVRRAIRTRRVEARRLRDEVEDLLDCLDALEARAASKGRKRHTLAEVRARLGLSPG